MDLVELIYKLTYTFPPEEKFGLTSQMRRAAVSIPSNIAEGYLRRTSPDFRRFCYNAFGSAGELETQLTIASRLGYVHNTDSASSLMNEILKMLNALIQKLTTKD